MTKLKSPLLSLGARGRLGEITSYRDGPTGPVALKTPTHPDAHTWPQIYHRFNYQDYIAWWNSLTPTQKATWRPAASRTHNTPMGAFLKDKLTSRADQVAIFHLDYISGGQSPDSSPNANHATVLAPTLQPGHYDQALNFNGSSDYLDVPNTPSLNPDYITVECWVKPTLGGIDQFLLWKMHPADPWESYRLALTTANIPYLRIALAPAGATVAEGYGPGPLTINQWSHILATFDGAQIIVYLNGVPGTPTALTGTIWQTANPLYISYPTPFWWHGLIDELRLYNRAIASAEAAAHYARRV